MNFKFIQRHVQRGATWKNSRHFCLGRQATPEELPPCYTGISHSLLVLYVQEKYLILNSLSCTNCTFIQIYANS